MKFNWESYTSTSLNQKGYKLFYNYQFYFYSPYTKQFYWADLEQISRDSTVWRLLPITGDIDIFDSWLLGQIL